MNTEEFINRVGQMCSSLEMNIHEEFFTSKNERCYSWSKRIGRLVHKVEVIHPRAAVSCQRANFDLHLIAAFLVGESGEQNRTIDFFNLAEEQAGRSAFKIAGLFSKFSHKQAARSYHRALDLLDENMSWFEQFSSYAKTIETLKLNGSNAVGRSDNSKASQELVEILKSLS